MVGRTKRRRRRCSKACGILLAGAVALPLILGGCGAKGADSQNASEAEPLPEIPYGEHVTGGDGTGVPFEYWYGNDGTVFLTIQANITDWEVLAQGVTEAQPAAEETAGASTEEAGSAENEDPAILGEASESADTQTAEGDLVTVSERGAAASVEILGPYNLDSPTFQNLIAASEAAAQPEADTTAAETPDSDAAGTTAAEDAAASEESADPEAAAADELYFLTTPADEGESAEEEETTAADPEEAYDEEGNPIFPEGFVPKQKEAAEKETITAGFVLRGLTAGKADLYFGSITDETVCFSVTVYAYQTMLVDDATFPEHVFETTVLTEQEDPFAEGIEFSAEIVTGSVEEEDASWDWLAGLEEENNETAPTEEDEAFLEWLSTLGQEGGELSSEEE